MLDRMNGQLPPDYFRRDQGDGITAPDLSKDATFAEHIVRARGKRTCFTSLSLDVNKIDDFGPQLYQALSADIHRDGHSVVDHETLLAQLRKAATEGEKADRMRAIQAQRYARRRREALVKWNFHIGSIERKDLITWAFGKIQAFFKKV